ncbi:MAG TPA: hypothetical protein VJS92_00860 [Candidatus Polarisedimenticolaceae bacterium]|nr:hypothetical protein [Candidatus Polarisedimenticolaceae bacterium]
MAFRRKRWALALALVTVVAIAAWHLRGPRRTPTGQPALRSLESGTLAAFQREFDGAGSGVQVLLLLSPT